MNCAECRDNLVAFAEGLLDHEEPLQCQAHLKACADCRAEYRAITNLQQQLIARSRAAGAVAIHFTTKMLLFLILSAAVMSAHAAPASATNSPPAGAFGYDKAIEKYVSFLEKQKQTPVDYILGLFKQNDMVILCERSHPEVTQYDMIYGLVSDPRFQQQGGHIFTEIGSAALRPYIESFLMDDQLSDEQVTGKLRYIAWNIGWNKFWDKTNFYDFLRRLYYLNRSLPKDRRVHVYPSDLDFRWENATKESWAGFKKTQLDKRDKLMAENIISNFNAIRQAGGRNKALVIMNYRHAFPHLKLEDGGNIENTGGFLMEAYPGRVANVMINTVAPLPSSKNDQKWSITAMQGGKWDAAFTVVGNPDVGFDFNGSPLGEDGFDYFPFFPTRLRYRDVFTGFVFFKPLGAHRMSLGFPAGLFDQNFADELLKRFRSTEDYIPSDMTSEKKKIEEVLGTVHISGYEDKEVFPQSDCSEKIQQWLKVQPQSVHAAPASATNSSPAGAVGYDKAIEQYVSFLEKQKQTPVDYILGLFKQNEMVILCERDHPEVTQYDMIYGLVSDPRFQQQGGHIFTEIGSAALRPYIESFLMDDQLSDEQVNEKLRYIARNIGFTGGWEKTSFYDFLRKIYYLNRSLPKDRRVHVYPSDLDFRWENATKESWSEFRKTQLGKRDKLMAENIIGKFNAIRQAGSLNKALVIMNYRHAFPHIKRENGENGENTGGFLMEAYPGRVANVMINSVAPLPGSTNQKAVFTAMQNGKWDAAFAVLRNPNVGFDFKGSPLGEDGFDYWPFPTHLQYQVVFTGFVFFKPLNAHRMSIGLPAGLFDQNFADELVKRFHITGDDFTKEEIEKMFGTVHVFGYDFGHEALPNVYRTALGPSDYAEKIQQWLKAKP